MSTNLGKPLRLRNDGGAQLQLERSGTARSLTVNASGNLEIDGTLIPTALTTATATITGGSINGTPVGGTTPNTGAFTTLTASSTATLNTLASSGATITGGSINATPIGGTTPSTGAFSTLAEAGSPVVVQTDLGSAVNEIPLNQYLGTLAFQDSTFPSVGQLQRSYVVLANNTAAQALGTNFATQVGISADTTLTTTVPAAGTQATVVIVSVGASSRTVTFGTGFASTGTLATGTDADRRFVVQFISDGTRLLEVSRTTAITV